MRFPRDFQLSKAVRALEKLGFSVAKTGNHIKLNHRDGKRQLVLPNHRQLKSTTLLRLLAENNITRKQFLEVA